MREMNKLKVLFVGHVGSETGYGRAARDWCRALEDFGDVELAVIPITGLAEGVAETFEKPDIVVVHERIPWAEKAFDRYDKHITGNTPIVLATAWEVSGSSPDIVETCENFDAIIVPTVDARRNLAVNRRTEKELDVHVIPHACDLDFWRQGFDLRHTEQTYREGPFRFLYVGAWNDRKNPAGILKAYLHTFYAGDNVELVLHCPGMKDRDYLEAKGILASSGSIPKDLPNLQITSDVISDKVLRQLYASADVFVTASRGEAFNLPALEAAAAGCTLLGTFEGLPILRDTGVDRVGASSVPVFPGGTVRPAGNGVQFEASFPKGITCRQSWGEPDLGELSEQMKDLSRHGIKKPRLGMTCASAASLNRYSYETVGRAFGDLLRSIATAKGEYEE
jgi:glycosyltransferase involved in cell wall biosynthesis